MKNLISSIMVFCAFAILIFIVLFVLVGATMFIIHFIKQEPSNPLENIAMIAACLLNGAVGLGLLLVETDKE